MNIIALIEAWCAILSHIQIIIIIIIIHLNNPHHKPNHCVIKYHVLTSRAYNYVMKHGNIIRKTGTTMMHAHIELHTVSYKLT